MQSVTRLAPAFIMLTVVSLLGLGAASCGRSHSPKAGAGQILPTTTTFPFGLWGPWNDGRPHPPLPQGVPAFRGVLEFHGACPYLIIDVVDTMKDINEAVFASFFGSEQNPKVLLVFPDDSPLGRTQWHPEERAVSFKGGKFREGDYLARGSWYYERDVDIDRGPPASWQQVGRRVIQEWSDSCDTRFVLGL